MIANNFQPFRAGYGIYHKTGHDENIRTEAFLLISSALSSYSGILRAKAISYAQAGKTYTELMQGEPRTN